MGERGENWELARRDGPRTESVCHRCLKRIRKLQNLRHPHVMGEGGGKVGKTKRGLDCGLFKQLKRRSSGFLDPRDAKPTEEKLSNGGGKKVGANRGAPQ